MIFVAKESTAQTSVNRSHIERLAKINRKWTKEKVAKEARLYQTKSEFYLKSRGAYAAAFRMGIIDDVCSHMIKLREKSGHWNEELAREEAKKNRNRRSFMTSCGGAYVFAKRSGILDDICSHMLMNGQKWTIEKCKLEAMKYKKRSDFSSMASGAYAAASKFGILDEICSHMKTYKDKSNIFYIWEVISPMCSDCYKVGVANSKRPTGYRSQHVSKSIGVSVGNYIEFNVGVDNATELEKYVIERFYNFYGFNGDGSTEIVHIDKCDLDILVNRIKKTYT